MRISLAGNFKLSTAALILLVAPTGLCIYGGGLGQTNPDQTKVARLTDNAGPALVATVDGKPIIAKIYRMYLKNGIEALGLNDQTREGRKKIEQLKEGIISDLIDRALIEAEVKRRNLTISDEALEAAYKKSVEQLGGLQPFRAYLAEHGLTADEFRQTTASEVYARRLREELDKEVAVNPSEARDFYRSQKNNPARAGMFKEPGRVRASHILIGARPSQIAADLQSKRKLSKAELDRLVSDEMAKRRGRAARILAQIKAGADFARLAREYSDDPGTRGLGGELGFFTRNTHTAKFDDAAFALRPGQVSKLIQTEYGYHIIKVTGRKPERTKSFDEVRPAIEQYLLARKQARHLRQWLERRRREADIRVEPAYRTARLQAEKD